MTVLPDYHDDVEATPTPAPSDIPDFEGQHVAFTKAKITSVGGLEVGDRTFRLDETVRLVVEVQVTGVDHKVNSQGKLERVHLMKAVDSVVIDWGLSLDALRAEL